MQRPGESREKRVRQYSILRTIGEGAFGKVKLGQVGSEFYAIKQFEKQILRRQREFLSDGSGKMVVKTALQAVEHEIKVMRILAHPNVVRLQEIIDDEEEDRLYIVMDYCSRGSVLEWDVATKTFYVAAARSSYYDEAMLKQFFKGVVAGLDYLHRIGIAHQDIKPQNILITEDYTAKLADFGACLEFQESDLTNKSAGTYFFFSPEICQGSGHHVSAKATDVWALGLTLFAMVFHKLPFVATCLAEIFEIVPTFTLDFPSTRPISRELRLLIERMLTKDPGQRITIPEILENPWLLG
jgi:[calcium/calmodulin-dependent protein kinase] kinase